MQDILTVLIELLVVNFSLLMVFDFVTGLQFSLPTFSIPTESEALELTQLDRTSAPPTASHQPIKLPDPWTLSISTEESTTTPLFENWQLTKPTLLLPPMREIVKQQVADYSYLSIRQLKKLASSEGICRYSGMTKQQLIQALTS